MLCNPNELCNSIKISNQIEWNFSSFYRNVFLCSVQRQILVWHGFSIKLLGVPCVHRIPLVNISVFFQITNHRSRVSGNADQKCYLHVVQTENMEE